MVGAVGFLLLGSTPLIASSGAGATQSIKVVEINGKNSFQANNYFISTYHFASGTITVHQGDQVLFKNNTRDGHTMTLVAAAELPQTPHQVENCNLCNAVNGEYFPNPNGGPAGVQIDNGVLGDDSDADADTPDPAAPGPFNALIEDFDSPSHSNATGGPTIGDSTLIGPVGGRAPSSRTIVVTAAPGTTLHYFCTFHAWMQGTIVVK